MYEVCVSDTKCGHGQFKCMFSEGCIPAARVCDGHDDCVDQTDEKDCHGQGEIHAQLLLLSSSFQCHSVIDFCK